ncbi:MAG: hypothetical protein KKH91_00650 [Elusimicrobia bacterium]|nr:hypothetical protein [Elusimicrobiota bacterium]
MSKEIVCFSGSPKEVGKTIGKICGESIKKQIKRIMRAKGWTTENITPTVKKAEKIQKRFNPDWVEEIYAIAQELNIPFVDVMSMTLLHSHCTPWMAIGNVTATGESIVAGSIDSPGPASVHIKNVNGTYKYISAGRCIFNGPPLFLNEKGVGMTTSFSGEELYGMKVEDIGLSSIYIARKAAETATCCEDVLEIFKQVEKDKLYHRELGSIYHFADKDKGLLVELNAFDFNYKFIKNDVLISPDSNFWLPAKASFYTEPKNKIMCFSRYFRVAEMLGEERGEITAQLFKKISRDMVYPQKVKYARPMCWKKTTVSFIAVIPKKNPEIFATAWVTAGRPNYTHFIPFPLGIDGILTNFVSTEVAGITEKLYNKYGVSNKFVPRFLSSESEMDEALKNEFKKAKILLKKGNSKQIKKNLTEFCLRNCQKSYEIVKCLSLI